jgi:rare lipoprotein A (peptidoglycan hydrolase)
MIPSSRRMFPGVLASMLLAAPLLATHIHPAAADPAEAGFPRKAQGLEYRRPAQLRSQRAAARHVAVARRRAPAAPSTVAFIDDAGAWHQSGVASWYGGPRWQGRPTASGTRYDQDALTAAHATLPLGSRVRVTLAGSERSVVVTITDRPGTRNIVIDLSRGAARALGILDRGIARVMLSLP